MKRPDNFKMPEPSGLRPAEIAAIVLAIAVPLALIILLLTPGAMQKVMLSMLTRGGLWAACIGGALLLTVVVVMRALRRAKKRKAIPKEDRAPTFWDFWRDPSK